MKPTKTLLTGIYKENSVRPRTEPSGTIYNSRLNSERVEPILMLWKQAVRLDKNHLNNSNSNSTFIALNLYLLTDSKTHKAKNQRS